MESQVLSAVVYRDGDLWIAQGLEYDICAQARTFPQLHTAFLEVIVANAAVCLELGREPLEGIDPAPQRFWNMYREARIRLQAEREPMRAPKPFRIPSYLPDYKLFDPVPMHA
jgi:hypothetical protein